VKQEDKDAGDRRHARLIVSKRLCALDRILSGGWPDDAEYAAALWLIGQAQLSADEVQNLHTMSHLNEHG
jgi:hypothetical protein